MSNTQINKTKSNNWFNNLLINGRNWLYAAIDKVKSLFIAKKTAPNKLEVDEFEVIDNSNYAQEKKPLNITEYRSAPGYFSQLMGVKLAVTKASISHKIKDAKKSITSFAEPHKSSKDINRDIFQSVTSIFGLVFGTIKLATSIISLAVNIVAIRPLIDVYNLNQAESEQFKFFDIWKLRCKISIYEIADSFTTMLCDAFKSMIGLVGLIKSPIRYFTFLDTPYAMTDNIPETLGKNGKKAVKAIDFFETQIDTTYSIKDIKLPSHLAFEYSLLTATDGMALKYRERQHEARRDGR